ncbi:right-handed parallel beta-helix repeat-containing protein [Paenibacillus roseipurpureus]|uniref:Right-handed parallel beta-helix repeat-containing protein n=1 Tax=Paenibacillus roseopurpureus TaxID=2918901 RepID=A0AA96RJN5_9BACL|nr:right-handed parallel beta-helix repeat-containing protein [Paenibacillus sp. MBLB1832]WNR43489.1 right-handed parallel beta-helix repeat-containing protein [Paenibacillus sp. MBLB1832]
MHTNIDSEAKITIFVEEVSDNSLIEAIESAPNGSEIILPGGTYYLTKPVAIHGKKNLKLRSREGERASLVGGVPLKGWTPYKEGIYKITVPHTFNELYENGKRSTCARWPKTGYLRSKGNVPDNFKASFLYDREDIPPLSSVQSLKTHLWPSGPMGEFNWHSVDMPIRIDQEERRVTLSQDTWYALGVGTRYYIYNSLELLTEPGEFFLDRERMELYYKPYVLPIEEQMIIMPTVRDIFHVQDSESITIEEMDLSCTDMLDLIYEEREDQDHAAVFIQRSRNIMISNMRIYNTGLNGVTMYHHTENVTVQGCHIHHIGHTGVRGMGKKHSRHTINKGHTVVNNHIHDLGIRVGQCAGVQLMYAGESVIMHNRIHDSVRYAISLLGTARHIDQTDPYFGGKKVQQHLLYEFNHTRDNYVAFNETFRCCTDSQDTGAIQAFCSGPNDVFYNNMVHDQDVPFSFANGIYLDDNCHKYRVEKNLVYRLNHNGEGKLSCAIVAKGTENVIRNNRVVDCHIVEDGGVISTFSMGPKENFDITIEENVFANNTGGILTSADWQYNRLERCDNNLYFNATGEGYHVIGYEGKKGELSLEKWKRAGYDWKSRIADPRFIDATNDDYRLRYDSDAFLLGQDEINMKDIGVMESYRMEEPGRVVALFPWSGNERSYLNLKSGEQGKLVCFGRTDNGMLIELTEAKLLAEGPEVLVNQSGLVTGVRTGACRIRITYEGLTTYHDVLVDDRLKEVCMINLPATMAVGESLQLNVIGRTHLGQSIKPLHVSFRSKHNLVSENMYKVIRQGEDIVSAIAVFEDQTLVQEFTVLIESDVLKGVELKLPKLASIGEVVPVKAEGVMYSGSHLHLSEFQVKVEDALVDGQSITFRSPSEQKITVIADGFTDSSVIRAVPQTNLPEGWMLSNYGDAQGAIHFADGQWTLYSNGCNIWFDKDDFTFLHKEIADSADVEVSMKIQHIEEIHSDSQCGILLRAHHGVDSRCVNLRVTPEGRIMLAARLEDGAAVRPIAGALSEWKQGGSQNGSVISEVTEQLKAFPVYLVLTYRNGTATAYLEDERGSQKIGAVEIELPPTILVGAALFSIDPNRCTSSSFTFEVKR